MTDFNFTNGPQKIMVDRFYSQLINGQFHLMLQSGKEQYVFLFDPTLAKKIGKYFSSQVEVLEKQLGVALDDRLDNEPMRSPFTDEGK